MSAAPAVPLIYTITVFDVSNLATLESPPRQRCWCWHPRLEDAATSLLLEADLYFEAGTYQLAVIEEVRPGLLGGLDARAWWFYAAYDRAAKSYVVRELAEAPAFTRLTTGCYSMG